MSKITDLLLKKEPSTEDKELLDLLTNPQKRADRPLAYLRHDPRVKRMEEEALQARKEFDALFLEYTKKDATVAERDELLRRLTDENQKVKKISGLQHLLKRVTPEAHNIILEDDTFAARFQSEQACEMFVMSIDIRRSTELMLKARSPQLFSKFITSLCTHLSQTVIENYGVVDKFTGDGVLAFFPMFFAGADAGFRALRAAAMSHKVFAKVYEDNHQCFTTILLDTGLGIGIDYGSANLVEVWEGLSVVGQPVVYACRMGQAPSTMTYLNQPAYEQVADKYKSSFLLEKTEIEIKSEGRCLAYSSKEVGTHFCPAEPEWKAVKAETKQKSAK